MTLYQIIYYIYIHTLRIEVISIFERLSFIHLRFTISRSISSEDNTELVVLDDSNRGLFSGSTSFSSSCISSFVLFDDLIIIVNVGNSECNWDINLSSFAHGFPIKYNVVRDIGILAL